MRNFWSNVTLLHISDKVISTRKPNQSYSFPLLSLFVFCHSPEPVPDVREHKNSSRGGEHHSNVFEDPSEAHQASCSHQQEEQGTHIVHFCLNIISSPGIKS